MPTPALRSSLRDVIDETVIASTLQLFSCYAIELSSVDRHETPVRGGRGSAEGGTRHECASVQQPHLAVIGYSGTLFAGSVGIALDGDLLRFLTAASGLPPVADAADDLLAESANQLLGRIKNGLRHHDITLAIPLPIVLHGMELSVDLARPGLWRHRFSSPEGDMTVWIDVRGMEEGALAPSPVLVDDGLLEGDVLFFD